MKTFSKKEILIFIVVVALFFLLRLPGLHIPYHQDEYKWPLYAEGIVYKPGSVPHPPLTEFIYVKGGNFVGLENLRYIPIFFATINLFLLFYLVKMLFDKKTAFWSVFLFSISFYSVLASLMVDVDGAVMPLFFLLASIGYFKLKPKGDSFGYKSLKESPLGWTMLLVGAIGGFLIKVVFVLPIAAFVLDFAIEKKILTDKIKFVKYILWILGGVVTLALVLIGIKFIFPFFDLGKALKYWEHFAVFSNRGWFQTLIQFIKSVLYTSPLLILPVFLVNKETWKKTRVFFFYIAFGLIFYLLLFDFSVGAIDRYMQFLVVPLCIITAAVIVSKLQKENMAPVLGVSVGIFLLQFLNHFVPPQYPKTEWISRTLHFKWNFLFPFSGGSGPTGFYISFAFMIFIWITGVVLLVLYLKNKKASPKVLTGIFILGLFYNGVFVEEYLFGKINGSPYGLFREAKAFIIKDSDIKQIIVYNDIGGWEIQQTGKYFRRMYAAPQFEEEYKKILENFKGYVLFIDIPRIYKNSLYLNYLNTCKAVFTEKDKYITGQVLDCSNSHI